MTQMQDMLVSQYVVAQTLHEVDALNLEISKDTIGSIQYLSHQSGRRISKLEANIGGDECLLMRSMQSGMDTRWPEGGVATYGRRNSFTVNIFKHVRKWANMLIPHSLVIPCYNLFPVVVQEVSGKWLEFCPRVTEIPAPTMIQHKDGQMRETLIHELFTASQLQS